MSDRTMLCAYCSTRKPWDREHFPDRMAAMCADCWEAERLRAAIFPTKVESALSAAVDRCYRLRLDWTADVLDRARQRIQERRVRP